MWLASSIFLITISLVIWQPRQLNIGITASVGAVVALLAGVIQVADIPVVWALIWNATLTFIGIIIISALMDEAGLFEWAALHVARWGKGHAHRLFIYIILLGAVVSALFANDGAALILTPIVIAILYALGFSPSTTLAFVMAAGFIADTASTALIVSNLTNIVSADFFKLNFSQYAHIMLPVNAVAVLSSLLVLYVFYRKDLPHSYALQQLKAPKEAINDPISFIAGIAVLCFLLLAFFVIEPLGVPISLLVALATVVLVVIVKRQNKIALKPILTSAPWHIVIFSLGMYLVVYGLRNAGLTDYLAQLLNQLATQDIWLVSLGTGFLTAALSSVMNNLPSVLIGALAIDASHAEGVVRETMIYANVIGSDLGTKFTPIGSLATLLWLHILQRKQIHISWGYYMKVGIVLTTPVLAISLLALAWIIR
ncbi:arsenic transporter [Pseudomonas sp. F1_0610]|uniref:arsenic transporter n=1 Tax=Pseudomonas sp. F1_0610 TaxID=3114284 RepID=UPI0039C4BE2E